MIAPEGFDAFGSPPSSVRPGIVKIAVLRANRLGDFLMALPALESLQAAYPAATITLLGLAWHHEFLSGRPGPVDRVVVVPPARGVSLPEDTRGHDEEALDRFFDEMRAEKFDLALQMQGGGRYSNPFVKRLGARTSAGPRDTDAIPLDLSLPYDVSQPETLRYLELISLVAARPVSLQGHVFLRDEDVRESAAVVPADERPLVTIHPGAQDPRRRWPVEKFAELGDRLVRAGARVVVTGSAREAGLVDSVAAHMGEKALALGGALSLNGLAGLLSRSVVVVGNDSGPLHLARCLGARTVGVYWCWNAMNCAPLARRLHRVHISWRTHCDLCGIDVTSHTCDHETSLVADVPTQLVVTSAQELLDEAAS